MKDSKIKTKKNEMPLKHETIKGTLIDYRGMSRDFTMVAVSIPVKNELGVYECQQTYVFPPAPGAKIDPEDECRTITCFDADYSKVEGLPKITAASTYDFSQLCSMNKISTVRKILSIGVAVRCNREKDSGLGEFIAYGKALKNAKNGIGHLIYVSHDGMINTKMVRALLEQEAEHFAKDPGSYIKSYNADRDRFIQTGRIANAELTVEEYNLKMGKEGTMAIEPSKAKIDYTPEKVLNETEEQNSLLRSSAPEKPTTFGSVAPTTYGESSIIDDDEPLPVDDTHLEPDVEPDIPDQSEEKKYMSPMQQRLQRMSGKK